MRRLNNNTITRPAAPPHLICLLSLMFCNAEAITTAAFAAFTEIEINVRRRIKIKIRPLRGYQVPPTSLLHCPGRALPPFFPI